MKISKIGNITILFFLLLIFTSCQEGSNTKIQKEKITGLNSELILELKQMVEVDQNAQFAITFDLSKEERDSLFKVVDEVFKSNCKRTEEILNQYGFPRYDLVGEEGSNNFWILVQHCDHNLPFQEKVLEEMRIEVLRENASNDKFAFLVDRVATNKGEKQIYGTQLDYVEDFWIVPKSLKDSVNVNKRRAVVGLPTIEEYLNSAMQLHFDMNKNIYEKQGIKAPRQYAIN